MSWLRPLLVVMTAHALTGCWLLQRAPEAPGEAPPNTRLAAWSVGKLGVVPFSDATHQGAGPRVSAVFARELVKRLGLARAGLLQTSGADVGLIGIGQAQRLGRANHVDALVAGNVLAYQRQRHPERVLVTVGLRLLDTNRGSIIWSRTASGSVPLEAGDAIPFEEAAARAAKEFIDDLLAAPPQAHAPRGDAARRRHGWRHGAA